jgi:type II secretory pathway component PulF
MQEFELKPPAVFQWNNWFSHVVVQYWYFYVLALCVLLWLAFTAHPGRILRRTFFAKYFRSVRELRAADILDKLSVTTSAGRPIAGALSTLARYHFDPTIRHQLLFVRNEVEQGAEVWQSLATAGILSAPEAHALQSAERLGNRPWVLKQLAANKERRVARRFDRFADLLLPGAIVVLGAFVLIQALSVFLPLVRILDGLLS